MRMLHSLWSWLWRRPAAATHLTGTAADLVRSKPDLLIENALLRHQLVVLRRSVKRPMLTPADRTLLVLLAGRLRSWRQALCIIQPNTLLRWHRAGYRLVLEREVTAETRAVATLGDDDYLDQRDGCRQSPLGRRTHPR